MAALTWDDDRAVGPDGTIYVLASESIRGEGTWWDVHVHEDPDEPPTRKLGVESGSASKARARALAERDAKARG